VRHPEVLAGLILAWVVLARGTVRLQRRLAAADSRDRYRTYMRSGRWQRKRRACLRAAGYRCRVRGCWVRARTAHHPAYPQRLGTEPWWTLVALCWPHHRAIHARERWLRARGVARPAALRQATTDILTRRVGWAA
jgi:hypothetical protein